jgi:RES domain-containing protein
MILFHLTKARYRRHWPPEGALHAEGRWNKPGEWVIYTSPSISLAKLEILANHPLVPPNCYCIEIEVPDDASVYEVSIQDLPDRWYEVPYPTELHLFTKKFLQLGHLLMKVPSAQSHRESNFLINVRHPEFKEMVHLKDVAEELFDHRLDK